VCSRFLAAFLLLGVEADSERYTKFAIGQGIETRYRASDARAAGGTSLLLLLLGCSSNSVYLNIDKNL